MKIVINKCYGGFGLSKMAYKELGLDWDGYGYEYKEYKERSDPKLVAVVEKLGRAANGKYAELSIVEIPNDTKWTIEEYDGIEWIAEEHRTWS